MSIHYTKNNISLEPILYMSCFSLISYTKFYLAEDRAEFMKGIANFADFLQLGVVMHLTHLSWSMKGYVVLKKL